jgi:hypothetical protein
VLLSVVFVRIEPHDFWPFGVVHIFWIVVVFIEESFDGLFMELFPGCVNLVESE